MNALKVHARWDWSYYGLCLYIFEQRGDERYLVKDMAFEHHERGSLCQPSLVIEKDTAQMLMDELYAAGIRPSEGATPGQLGEAKAHIETLREVSKHFMELQKRQQ